MVKTLNNRFIFIIQQKRKHNRLVTISNFMIVVYLFFISSFREYANYVFDNINSQRKSYYGNNSGKDNVTSGQWVTVDNGKGIAQYNIRHVDGQVVALDLKRISEIIHESEKENKDNKANKANKANEDTNIGSKTKDISNEANGKKNKSWIKDELAKSKDSNSTTSNTNKNINKKKNNLAKPNLKSVKESIIKIMINPLNSPFVPRSSAAQNSYPIVFNIRMKPRDWDIEENDNNSETKGLKNYLNV